MAPTAQSEITNPAATQHVVNDQATRVKQAHEKLSRLVTEDVLRDVTGEVPAGWFGELRTLDYSGRLRGICCSEEFGVGAGLRRPC